VQETIWKCASTSKATSTSIQYIREEGGGRGRKRMTRTMLRESISRRAQRISGESRRERDMSNKLLRWWWWWGKSKRKERVAPLVLHWSLVESNCPPFSSPQNHHRLSSAVAFRSSQFAARRSPLAVRLSRNRIHNHILLRVRGVHTGGRIRSRSRNRNLIRIRQSPRFRSKS